MPLRKLTTTEAFVVSDFDDVPAFGRVRLAPKILQRGAWEMARSATYQAALHGVKMSGASAGINSPAETRSDAITAFGTELTPEITSGQLFLTPGKGLGDADRAALAEIDQRPAAALANHDTVQAAGVVAAAEAAAGGLDGKTVCIEGFTGSGPHLAQEIADRGGRIGAISTSAGSCTLPQAASPTELGQAWAEHGPAMIEHIGADGTKPAHMVFGSDCDVLLIGSKMGALDHRGAEFVTAGVVVAHSEVPYTTKAVVNVQRAGRVVVPDVVSLTAPVIAAFGEGAAESAVDARTAASAVGDLTRSLLDHPDGLVMGAFLTAEEFLRTWQETLPFGRPFAP